MPRHGGRQDDGLSGGVNLDPEQRSRQFRRERRQERNEEQRLRRVERRAKRAEELAGQDDSVSLIETVVTLPDPTSDYLGRSLLLIVPGDFRSTINTAIQLGDDSIVWVEMEQGSVAGIFAWSADIGVGTLDFDRVFSTGIDVTATGDVWVVDPGIPCIRRYNPDGTLAATGSGGGHYVTPNGVCVSPAGDVWITDTKNGVSPKVQKHDGATGAYISDFGYVGFVQPLHLAFNPAGTLMYVTDGGDDRVWVFNTAGAYQADFGKGTLFGPIGIATDSAGNIYVCDSRHAVVRKYNASYTQVDIWGILDDFGNSPGQFNVNWGICVDEIDRVYVVDRDNHRVQMFDTSGNYITKLGAPGAGSALLSHPVAVAVYQGNAYIIDTDNDRISHWIG